MRRIARATRPWDLIPAANTRLVSNSPICLFCQHRDVQRRTQRPAFSTSSRPQANDDVSFLERTRRRLWGTDQPPGAEDPYTGKPRQARQKVERQQALEKKAEEETTADIDDITTYEAQALREEKELFQAAVLDAPNHEGYVPAQTWDGLETVGGEAEWNSGKVFKGFIPSKRLQTSEEITMAVHRAVVEVFAALAASRPLKKLPYLQPGALLDETSQVQILPTADGLGAVLRFPNNEVKQVVLQLSSSKTGASTIEVPGVATTEGLGVAAEEEAVISEHKPEFASVPQAYTIGSLKQSINSWGRAWYHISLAHPVIKFAIVRRIVHLTGLHISDHLIHKTQSVGFLVTELSKAPPPKTLYEQLAADKKLTSLSNVSLAARRITPVDKEKKVGRWKLIEQELRRRDLPVLGHN